MSELKMRHMTPADVPRVHEVARQQNERDGTSYPVPVIFDANGRPAANAPLALVTERDGEVVQGHIFIRTLELMSFGTDPRATALSIRNTAPVFYLLAEKGYDDLHVLVPKVRVDAMETSLAKAMGLQRDDDRLAHFYRELRQER